MKDKTVNVAGIKVGGKNDLVLIAGPCVIESRKSVLEHACRLKKISKENKIKLIFKASYDKANRTSLDSFRGPGIRNGLEILRAVKEEIGLPVVSDVHAVNEIEPAQKVLDVIQIPAFLCRQTDLMVEAGKTGKPVNVKKGQFMSPEEMNNVVNKLESVGNKNILLTERGTTFGYNMLVNDFRSIPIMGKTGYPVVYDATHSVQRPGGLGGSSGGDSQYIFPLAKAAVACGADAIFLEIHKNPGKALSDGKNMLKLKDLKRFIIEIKKVRKAVMG